MSDNSSHLSVPTVAEAMLTIVDGDEKPFAGKVPLTHSQRPRHSAADGERGGA